MRGFRWLLAPVLAATLAIPGSQHAARAQGQENTCRVVDFEMTPSDGLQMVIWIEDDDGNFVDTAFITRLTGTYGLGNRPGRMDFNTAYRWPYGRRISTFPIWAHRHGMTWPLVIFQDEAENNLSHGLSISSDEYFYCRPFREGEEGWDAQTCATSAGGPYTDKGKFSPTASSLYPPRSDLEYDPSRDDPDVQMYAALNPFDAVSKATPEGGKLFRHEWPVPTDLLPGNYVAWIEVSKELDHNETYSVEAYPEPVGIAYSEYGIPYRGQPSVVYKVPFTIANDRTVSMTDTYVGYGDPDGLDGDIRPPDSTITTGVPGSGAGRLRLTSIDGDMFRMRVVVSPPRSDVIAPGGVSDLSAEPFAQQVVLRFIAPGDDDQEGTASSYQIRYQVGDPMTEESFATAQEAGVTVTPLPAGGLHEVTISGLIPSTNYTLGIRAIDDCGNAGPVTTVAALTPQPPAGAVDACFVATAAYGSKLAADVAMLRRARDVALRSHVTGELLVEAYYTVGPALAEVIAPSDTLRRAARGLLAPAVDIAREVARATAP